MGFTAVFGFVFSDVKGFSQGKYNPTGRNVGDVVITHGGVCGNVSKDLVNIETPVSFVTMFEPDALGMEARMQLEVSGVNLLNAVNVKNGMGLWLAVMNENGDLAGSISRQPDCAAMEALIDERGEAIIRECDNVVLEIDMNEAIAEKVLDLAEKYRKDVYAIVANMSVILKRPDFLRRTRMFILNEIEAGALFGCALEGKSRAETLRAAKKGAEKYGIREIIVTMGAQGAVYYDAQTGESGEIPARKVAMVDSTGAGDAFFSGAVAARMRGIPIRRAAELGTVLAALTIQTEESACPRMPHFFDNL